MPDLSLGEARLIGSSSWIAIRPAPTPSAAPCRSPSIATLLGCISSPSAHRLGEDGGRAGGGPGGGGGGPGGVGGGAKDGTGGKLRRPCPLCGRFCVALAGGRVTTSSGPQGLQVSPESTQGSPPPPRSAPRPDPSGTPRRKSRASRSTRSPTPCKGAPGGPEIRVIARTSIG